MTQIRPSQIQQAGAAVGDTLTWNGTEWAPSSSPQPLFADDGSGGLTTESLDGWVYPD